MPGGNNLHRNGIFRDGKDKAETILPLSSYDTQDAEQLWEWMAAYEKKTGGQLIAIVPDLELTVAITSDPARPARSEGYFGELMRLFSDSVVPEAESA